MPLEVSREMHGSTWMFILDEKCVSVYKKKNQRFKICSADIYKTIAETKGACL